MSDFFQKLTISSCLSTGKWQTANFTVLVNAWLFCCMSSIDKPQGTLTSTFFMVDSFITVIVYRFHYTCLLFVYSPIHLIDSNISSINLSSFFFLFFFFFYFDSSFHLLCDFILILIYFHQPFKRDSNIDSNHYWVVFYANFC